MFARTCHGVKITPWMAYVQYESTSSFMHKNKTSTCARVLVLEA